MANWKKIVGGVAAAVVTPVVVLLAYASTRPDEFRVERSLRMEATPGVIYAQIEDFHAWPAWSPWEKLDPAMQRSFSGPAKGIGAGYQWAGNKDVGKGRMTITDAVPPSPAARIIQRLEFLEPFQATNTVTFTITPAGAKASKVTWSMDGRNNLVMKAFGLFMNMDKQVGADFEKGLLGLKAIAEKAPAAASATP